MSGNTHQSAIGTASSPKTLVGKQAAAEAHPVPEVDATGDAAATATRACPTRVAGPAPLFQHSLTVAQCQSKQRGLYHKCFTCAHANGRP